jgi:hypothetical protein
MPLGAIVLKQKKICSYFYCLVDKAYHNGREIAQCLSNNITTIVAHPTRNKQRKRHATGLFGSQKYNK